MTIRTSSHAQSEQTLGGHRRAILLATAAVGLSVFSAGGVANAADFSITVDAGKEVSGNPHFWSACVGTGTASLTLRPDLQTHYKLGNRELGFQRVRGHGVLNDDMGIYKADGNHDWSKYDTYLAAITAAKMVPLMELSFMPKALSSSGNDRNPPKDYATYQKFIQAVVQHTVEKMGKEEVSKWYWEVWNEWNYSGFWTGTGDDYNKLYAAAFAGATAALPDILIGGPVTTQGSTSQMTSFINYVKSNNLRTAFLSSHAYCGGEQDTADASFAVSDNDGRVGVITKAGYTTDKILSFNTEWSSSYSGQGGSTAANVMSMDTHANAPFIVKTVKLMADKTVGDTPAAAIFSYWAMSDVFDEYGGAPLGSYILGKTANGTLPFGSVFGLVTFQGMRKAAFNGFKMLNYLGEKRLGVTGGTGTKDGVDGMAAVSADGSQVQIIVYNYYAKVLTTGTDNVTVTVDNLPFAGKEAYITRFAVDEKTSNPYSVWVGLNKPSAPTEANWQAMRKAQHLMPVEDIAKKTMESKYTATFAIPKQGASLIILSLKRPLTGRDAKVEIEGEDYDGQSGITKEDSGDESMGQSISAAANSWAYFENVDYTDEGVDTVQLRVKNAAETSVELRSESETGTSLGKCTLPASTSWATQTCKLSAPATGVSKLYLMFAGATRLNWFKFSGAGGTPTGGSGGNSGTGGTTGTTGTGGGGGKGGTTGAGGNTGSSSGGSTGGGSGGSKSSGTSGGAGQSSAGSSAGSSSSSSKSSGGSAGQSSSGGGGSSSSGGKVASSSSSDSGSKGGSSGQGNSDRASSSSTSKGSSSGGGCHIGSTGRGSQGTFSLLGLLLGVLAMRKRRDWVRASRAGLALFVAACGSNGGGSGAGGQGGSDSKSGGSSGMSSSSSSSGGSGGTSSASSSSKSSGGSDSGGKSESGGSSAPASSSSKAGSTGGGTGTGTGGTKSTGGTGGGGTGTTKTGGTTADTGSGGTSEAGGTGGTASGTGGKGGTAGTGSAGTTSSNPPSTISLATYGPSSPWKTDVQPKEVTSNADVTVNDGSPAQDWEGFGAAFNEKGWYYLAMLSEADRNQALNLLFSADGANFAWGRIPIGATDYALERYTCNETKDDVSMSKFSIDRDKEKLIPFIKAAKAIKTDMHFWASPWTPPTWLKSGPFNDDSPYDGGKMKTDATSLKALADYFVKFVQAYAEQDIKIEIVSPQNEPGYSGTYPTCGWDPTAYATFVGKHLGPALSAANLSVNIMLGTFNGGTGDTDIVKTVMGDATAKPFIKVLGYQWGMDPSGAKSYGVPIWQTEHKCGNYPWETYNKDKAPNDQAYGVESWGLIRDWIKKGVTSYSTWNVVLDTIGLGNDSARVWPQDSLLTVDATAKKLIATPAYYVFRHFSQFVKPGAKVVGTTGGDAVAFKNPDNSIVTVLYNKDAEKTMTVAAGGKKLQFTAPATGWATVIAR